MIMNSSKKITFSIPVIFYDCADEEITELSAEMDNLVDNEIALADHLDDEIADFGVDGGIVKTKVENDRCFVLVEYWVSGSSPSKLVDNLKKDLEAQLSDGAGEGGFEFEYQDSYILAIFDEDTEIHISISEDPSRLFTLPSIAIAARDGKYETLTRLLKTDNSSLTCKLQGALPLAHAILSGHFECAIILIEAGSFMQDRTDEGDSYLHLCAISNSLDDNSSLELAKFLIQRGVEPTLENDSEFKAVDYASNRNKVLLAEYLANQEQ